jgi:hypothetical protein
MVVHRITGGLDNVNVAATYRLMELDLDFAVRKVRDRTTHERAPQAVTNGLR